MRRILILSLTGCLVVASVAHAQPEVEWEHSYNRAPYDQYRGTIDKCTDFIKTSDGGYALAGYTEMNDIRHNDYWLVKTDSIGRVQWSRRYGGEQNDVCLKIIEIENRGFLLAGNTYPTAYLSDVWLLRTNSDGDSVSSIVIGDEWSDDFWDLVPLAEGELLIAILNSERVGEEEFTRDPTLIKINNQGEIMWEKVYRIGYVHDQSLLQMSDGGFALLGTLGSGDEDGVLLRLNEDCDSMWTKVFDREYEDYFTGLVESEDGGFTIGGWGRTIGVSAKIGLIRTDSGGDTLWTKIIGSPDQSHTCAAILSTLDNGFGLAGDLWDGWDPRNAGGILVKTDSTGNHQWTFVIGDGSTEFRKVVQNLDGSYSLAGNSGGDFYLVKTSPDPVSVPESDFILHPSAFILFPPFPNPFNSVSVASYELRRASRVNLVLYDTGGRMVQTLVDGWQNAGVHRVLVNAPNLAAGEYLIVLMDGRGQREARKVALVK